jgi:hypothetical protein
MRILIFLLVTAVLIGFIVSLRFRFVSRMKMKWLGVRINVLPVAELISVVIYLYWVFYFLFSQKSFYLYLVIGFTASIILIVLVFLLRDFIPGMAYRTDTMLKPGLSVLVNNEKSDILKLGLFRMILKTESGSKSLVPYSKIKSFRYDGSDSRQDADFYIFRIPVEDLPDAAATVEKIRNTVLTSSWLPAGSNPKIQLIGEEKKDAAVEVTVNAMNQQHARLIERRVKSLVSQKLKSQT